MCARPRARVCNVCAQKCPGPCAALDPEIPPGLSGPGLGGESERLCACSRPRYVARRNRRCLGGGCLVAPLSIVRVRATGVPSRRILGHSRPRRQQPQATMTKADQPIDQASQTVRAVDMAPHALSGTDEVRGMRRAPPLPYLINQSRPARSYGAMTQRRTCRHLARKPNSPASSRRIWRVQSL